jgi:hypothetical protein
MTCSQFIAQIENRYDVAFVGLNGSVVVLGLEKLPSFLVMAIRGHRQELIEFLTTKHDRKLSVKQAEAELKALGLIYIPALKKWTHALGDEACDALISGLRDPEETTAEQQRHARELEGLGHPRQLPRPVEADATAHHPGFVTWTQSKDQPVVKPFSDLPRI